MHNLIVIPARGGSVGIKNKNLKLLNKKPLVCHALDLAFKIHGKNSIVLSTDSKKIISVCKKYKKLIIPFIRPKKLSSNSSKISDVIIHLINFFKKKKKFFDYLILLEPTCPFRNFKEINCIISDVIKKKVLSAFTVCDVWQHPNEYITIKKKKIFFLGKKKESNRQHYQKTYFINGALYIINSKFFLKKKNFINANSSVYKLPPHTMIDIDEPLHLNIARHFYKNYRKIKKNKFIRLI